MNETKLFPERIRLAAMDFEDVMEEFDTCDLEQVTDERLCALLEWNDIGGDFEELSRAELLEIMNVERDR